MRVIEFDAPDSSLWATARGDMLTASNIPIEQMSKAAFLPMDWSGKPATKTFLHPVDKEAAAKAWFVPHSPWCKSGGTTTDE